MVAKSARKGPSIPEAHLTRLAELVKEYRCPDCKAWAMYVKVTKRGPTVLCRKCAFNMPLAEFATKHMAYRRDGDSATITYTDMFGDEKVVEL